MVIGDAAIKNALGFQRTIDRCTSDFQGLGDGRRSHPVSLHLLDLRGVNARLAALVDTARLRVGNTLKLSLASVIGRSCRSRDIWIECSEPIQLQRPKSDP